MVIYIGHQQDVCTMAIYSTRRRCIVIVIFQLKGSDREREAKGIEAQF